MKSARGRISQMARVNVYVSPRGGVGKSTACVILAASFAKKNPDKKILVIDFSMVGSASSMLLGGLDKPRKDTFLSRGAEIVDNISQAKRADGLLLAARNHANGMFPIESHCVNVKEVFAQSECESNIYVSAGGPFLIDTQLTTLTSSSLAAFVKGLRKALTSLPPEWTVFIDTDATVVSSLPSFVGLASSDRITIVTSTNWDDWLRIFTDGNNSLLLNAPGSSVAEIITTCALTKVEGLKLPECKPLIGAILFTKVASSPGGTWNGKAVSKMPSGVNISAIVGDHVDAVCVHAFEAAAGVANKRFFAHNVPDVEEFIEKYVFSIPEISSGVMIKSVISGSPASVISEQTLARHFGPRVNAPATAINTQLEPTVRSLEAMLQNAAI